MDKEFTPSQLEQIERIVEKVLQRQPRIKLTQSDVPPGTIKRRHLDDTVIVFGDAADRPDNDPDTGIKAYFATDTGVFSLWDGDSWVQVATNHTVQTYAASNVVTDRTYDADTVLVAELADIVGTLIADLRALGIVA